LGKDDMDGSGREEGNVDVLHTKSSPVPSIDRAAMSDALLPDILSDMGIDLNPGVIAGMVMVLIEAGFSRDDAFAGVQDIVHETLNLCVSKAKEAMDSQHATPMRS